MIDFQTSIENRAATLFANTHDVLRPIISHLEMVQHRERDFTGVGFYTKLEYSTEAKPLRFEQEWSFMGGVGGTCVEMPEGFWIGFHLKDGFLNTIEGLANAGDWSIQSEPELTMNYVEHEYRFLADPYLREDAS